MTTIHIRRTVRLALYIGLFVLTLEGAARLEDAIRDHAPLLGPYSINTLFRSNSAGREGIANARFAKWHLNQLGFRGPEPVPGRANILVYGASETFGIYESPEREYPRQLEAQLNAQSDRFNVINIAIPGLRIGRVRYLAHALEQTGAGVVVIYPTPANYIGATEPLCKATDDPGDTATTRLTLADHIRITGKLDQLFKRLVPLQSRALLTQWQLWRESRGVSVMAQVPQASIDAFSADLGCAIDVARQHGAKVVLATHATYFGDAIRPEDRPMLLAWRRFYPELAESGFLDLEQRANAAVREMAAARGLPLADAARLLPRGSSEFADFVHFTDQGATDMARVVGQAVTQTQ